MYGLEVSLVSLVLSERIVGLWVHRLITLPIPKPLSLESLLDDLWMVLLHVLYLCSEIIFWELNSTSPWTLKHLGHPTPPR